MNPLSPDMLFALRLHPDALNSPPYAVHVDIERKSSGLIALHYRVSGDMAVLDIPANASSCRTDELWRGTCFEAFLRIADAPGYCEFNFSPSTQWAAYRFDDYRAGMRPLSLATPRIDVMRESDTLGVSVELDLGEAADLVAANPLNCGIATILRGKDVSIQYWAIAHPPGRPDFHHPHCFAIDLATREAA